MKTLKQDFDIDGQTITIEVKRASIRDGVRRYLLASEGEEANKINPDPTLDSLRLFVYPCIMTATLVVQGLPWPLPVEEFADMDEDFVNKWMELIYQVNPHWKLSNETAPVDEVKKKSSKNG